MFFPRRRRLCFRDIQAKCGPNCFVFPAGQCDGRRTAQHRPRGRPNTVRRGRANPALPYKGLKPGHVKTGRRGYFAKFGSVAERRQRMNWLPRSLRIFWAWMQSAQSPACWRALASSASAIADCYDSRPRRILAARATPDSPLAAPSVLASESPFAPACASSAGVSPSPGARKRLLSRPCCLV
jgi:hypothetical protein